MYTSNIRILNMTKIRIKRKQPTIMLTVLLTVKSPEFNFKCDIVKHELGVGGDGGGGDDNASSK